MGSPNVASLFDEPDILVLIGRLLVVAPLLKKNVEILGQMFKLT
jgi:hypothetical protein